MFEREAQVCRIERDRASKVFDLIPDAMHALDEGVPSTSMLLSCFHRFSCSERIGIASRSHRLKPCEPSARLTSWSKIEVGGQVLASKNVRGIEP